MSVQVTGGPDAGLVWHSGNPLVEQRDLIAGRAAVRLANREAIAVEGPDRLGWLHSLTSQRFEGLAPGTSTTALVLSPTGHVEEVMYGLDDGQRWVAFTEPGHARSLVAFLDSMRFRLDVQVSDLSDAVEVVWMSATALEAAGDPPAGSIVRASDIPAGENPAVEVLIPRGSAWPDLPQAGTWAWDALRIEAGVPRVFVDTDERTIPNEIGLVGTHLDKGCYRGQETVARVYNLGRPPRRLVRLNLDGSGHLLPHAGAPIVYEQREVGFLGSVAMHHEMGPVGLGLIRRAVPLDAVLFVEDVPAAQEALVAPEVGLHVRPRMN